MMQLAERMSRLGTESAFQVLLKARALEAQGREVIHLEIGEPDFDTPAHIIEAACRALHSGATHYTPAQGIPELRQIIAGQLGARRGHAISPSQVVITPGAKPIMFFVIMALAEEGTEVIYPNPAFPIYESMINFVGAKAVPLPLREERDFRFDVNELKDLITDRTRLIILNSPQNPTGGILEHEDLAAIAEICVERDIPVLSDEVYEHIRYEGAFESISTFPGMSTKEEVTDLSGRGVGMDIVRANLERLSGSIEIHTQVGVGTTFELTLPLTLAIIPAMLVTTSGNVYAVPLSSVVEVLQLARRHIQTVDGHEVIRLRDKVLPLLRLRKLFGVNGSNGQDGDAGQLVVIRWGRVEAGLVVDELIGNQEVVIKSLGPLLTGIRGLAGGSILGSGRIALILDVPNIIKLAMRR